MHAAIISVGATGHVMASLPLSEALARRGVRVTYFTSENFRAAVERTGATFRPVDTALTKQGQVDKDVGKDMVAELPLSFLSEGMGAIEQILAALENDKPDVIIADSLALAGRMAASKLSLPLVLLFTSYAPNEHFSAAKTFPPVPDSHPAREKAHRMAREATERYGVPHLDIFEIFEGLGDLNVVMLQRAFHPAGEKYDERFVFVGAQIAKRENSGTWRAPEGVPVIYASLGTVFNNWPEFFMMLSEAVRGMPVQVEAAIGTAFPPKSLGALPKNMHVSAFQPQLDILEKASLFITHAGTGSVMEAIYYGVPMLAIPQMDEQMITASRLEELGLGMAIPDKRMVTPELLRESIEKILGDASIAERVRDFQRDMRASGGCEAAADAVIGFVDGRRAL